MQSLGRPSGGAVEPNRTCSQRGFFEEFSKRQVGLWLLKSPQSNVFWGRALTGRKQETFVFDTVLPGSVRAQDFEPSSGFGRCQA